MHLQHLLKLQWLWNIINSRNVSYLRLDKSEAIELEQKNKDFTLGEMRLFATGKDVTLFPLEES